MYTDARTARRQNRPQPGRCVRQQKTREPSHSIFRPGTMSRFLRAAPMPLISGSAAPSAPGPSRSGRAICSNEGLIRRMPSFHKEGR